MAYYERRRGGRRQLVFQGPLFQRMLVPAGAALAVVVPALRAAAEFWGDAGYPRVLLVIATTLGLCALAAALLLLLDPTISVIDEDGIRLARPLGSRSVSWDKVAALVVLPAKHMGSQRLFGHRVALLVCGRVLPMVTPGPSIGRRRARVGWRARSPATLRTCPSCAVDPTRRPSGRAIHGVTRASRTGRWRAVARSPSGAIDPRLRASAKALPPSRW